MDISLQLKGLRADAQALVDKLDDLLANLSPSPPSATADHVKSLYRTKAIEWVLRDHGGVSMRPIEIWAELQRLGRNDPKMEVQVTTFDLWERGRIGKSGRGQYHALLNLAVDGDT